VREVLDGLEAKVTGTAFERVERSENPVQRVLVGGVFLQNQDALFDVLQQIPAFIAKFVQ
jgi:hypothetical protein